VNRVGGGRLHQIAEKLGVTPSFFFNGADKVTSKADTQAIDTGIGLLRTQGAMRVLQAYAAMEPKRRQLYLQIGEIFSSTKSGQRPMTKRSTTNHVRCMSTSPASRTTAVVLAVLSVNVLAGEGLLVKTAVAQEQGRRPAPSAQEAVQNLSVVTQEWHRYPGLAVADIIFNNANYYEVRHPVVACDFLGPSGNVVANRGTTIFQTFPPASSMRINGVHFSLREKAAVPGSCRVLSVRTVAAPN
jgi:hypothetical protein